MALNQWQSSVDLSLHYLRGTKFFEIQSEMTSIVRNGFFVGHEILSLKSAGILRVGFRQLLNYVIYKCWGWRFSLCINCSREKLVVTDTASSIEIKASITHSKWQTWLWKSSQFYLQNTMIFTLEINNWHGRILNNSFGAWRGSAQIFQSCTPKKCVPMEGV